MSEWTMAYLMGPVVMLLVGMAIWVAAHYHQQHQRKNKPPRTARWLDTHYADWLHHRH